MADPSAKAAEAVVIGSTPRAGERVASATPPKA
jgi:hypothetical protein